MRCSYSQEDLWMMEEWIAKAVHLVQVSKRVRGLFCFP